MSHRGSVSSRAGSVWPGASEPSSPTTPCSLSIQRLQKNLPYREVRSSTEPKAYLFVDVQADNAKGSSTSREKQAFLLKQYHRGKKRASIDRLKTIKFLSPSPTPSPATSPMYEADESTPSEAYVFDNGATATNTPQTWSLQTYLDESFKDPFDCYAVPMTEEIHRYLDYFRIHGVKAYPLSITQMTQYMFQHAIALPALLNLYMFFAATHLAQLESKNAHSSSPSTRATETQALRIRGTALKSLNDLLQDPSKALAESTVVTVASFVTIEACMGNLAAVNAHLRGLKQIVKLLGGFEKFSHMTLFKLYQCDVKAAVLRNTHPIFPMTSCFRSQIIFGSEVFHSNECTTPPPAFAQLGVRFLEAPWFSDLSKEMRASIEIFRRLIVYFEQAAQRPEVAMLTDNDLLVAVEHQLLSMRFTTEDGLDEGLRLCLLIYMNIRVWRLGGLPIMGSLADALVDGLNLALLRRVSPDLGLWMLFIGGMGAQGGRIRVWYVAQLVEMSQLLGIGDWGEARVILGEYFYTDQTENAAAEDLWAEAMVYRSRCE